MTMRLPDIWSGLVNDAGPAPPDVKLHFVFSRDDVRVYAAVTGGEGLPALLLELPEAVRPRQFRVLVTRAFQVSVPSLKGLPSGHWALLLELKDRAYSDLFAVLAGDVLNAIESADASQQTLQVTLRCIDRWRRFVEYRREPLTDEEVRGLIGELVVLCRCARHFGADTALAAWTGPDRGLRDFELPDASVEVKTFQGDNAATIQISSPDQLDAVAERPVYLAAVRLTPSETQGITLPEFAGRTSGVLGISTTASDILEQRLATAGYLSTHAPLYTKRYIAGPLTTYTVLPGFPRIRSIDVPQGVHTVRFALSVRALAPFLTEPGRLIGDRVPDMEAV